MSTEQTPYFGSGPGAIRKALVVCPGSLTKVMKFSRSSKNGWGCKEILATWPSELGEFVLGM
jgi:hypothetical protein